MRDCENERSRYIGTRWQYNGKHLGRNYTGGRRNSSISFMFFNFLEDWGMGRLWIIFKKYGTVFDMFMVQKRLHNGQKFGFVRCTWHIGEAMVRTRWEQWRGWYVNRDMKSNGGGGLGREAKWDFNDKRRFVDVVNGKHTKCGRIIEIEEKDDNSELMGRSVVAEVKAICGTYGIRRWLHKLRRGDSFNRSAGRITWISILGVPVSCWGESAFQKIAALHGTILGMHTYRLEGNQHTVCGRVNIHTINKGLIKEDLQVKFKGKMHKLSVVEEAKDITNWAIQEAKQEDYVDESNKGNEKDIQVDEVNGKDSEEYNSKNGEDSNEKENREFIEIEKGNYRPDMDSVRHGKGEDERSSFSGETRVSDTFNGMSASSKEKHAGW
ncbi:hypothetical protein Tco_1382821 [Tanacetum coccineum]